MYVLDYSWMAKDANEALEFVQMSNPEFPINPFHRQLTLLPEGGKIRYEVMGRPDAAFDVVRTEDPQKFGDLEWVPNHIE